MGYWYKYFLDGSELFGFDEEVSRGLVSWSKGNCHLSMAKVNRGHNLVIAGPGEYWQSDTYESSLHEIKPVLIKTRIEKKVMNSDKTFSVCNKPQETIIKFNMTEWPGISGPPWITRPLPGGSIDKWLVLEYDLITKSVKTYFASEKI